MHQPNSPSRRRFIQTVTTVAVAGPLGLTGCGGGDDNDDDGSDAAITGATFTHGVASGDPLADRVILWTRAVPQGEATAVTLSFEMALDEAFSAVVASGAVTASAEEDYTAKVDATGLAPNTVYFYRFAAGESRSVTGRTKTLPQGPVEQVRLAMFSCSNYPAGFFHVYGEAALRDDLDAALHLGDYLYEGGNGDYATEDAEALGRVPEPPVEILSLADYRTRFAQYRSDPDLQEFHRLIPVISVWDDHEVANDSYVSGAENHDPDEGDYITRRDAALRAYQEWMPVRPAVEGQPQNLYRRFDFGDLASFYFLETRLTARDLQLQLTDYLDPATGLVDEARFTADLTDPNRTMLGAEQLGWLQNQLADSQATWQVLGQQVLMGRMNLPAPLLIDLALPGAGVSLTEYQALLQQAFTAPDTLTPEQQAILAQPAVPYNLDAWDGYPAEREALLATALQLDKNLLVLAGDTHNAWANNLQDQAGNAVGVEFATASVSSPGLENFISDAPAAVAQAFTDFIEPLQYADTENLVYFVLTLTPERAEGEWIFVDTVKSMDYRVLEEAGQRLAVLPGAANRALVPA
ncbi:MAG: alkaline phosphatase D family protein [Candidatus Competibacterales bacterium]